MTVLVTGYEHRTGEHCGSTALRNLLHFHGTEVSEPMIIGLAGGLGFYYLRGAELSPTRMFHGRSASLESDFCRHTGIRFDERTETDDEHAWTALRARLDSGTPVLIATDTYYLPYHRTTSHFPGHSIVVVGYAPASERVLLADRKFPEYQTCSLEELRRSRHADDYPQTCRNRHWDFPGAMTPTVAFAESLRVALRHNAETMLTAAPNTVTGTAAMRALAADLPAWRHLDDWSWAARFGYQVIARRGAGGSFFRSLYAEFLMEASRLAPEIAAPGLPGEMDAIAARWRELAETLRRQSEAPSADPELFSRAGDLMDELADAEEAFFRRVLELV